MTETTPEYVTQAAGPAIIHQQAQNSTCGAQPHPPAPPQQNQQPAAPPEPTAPPNRGSAAETPPNQPERARFSMAFNGTRHALLIKAGTANGYYFSEDVLRAAVPLFDGRPCFVDHGDFSFFGPINRSVRDLAGHIQNAHYSDQAQGIVADIMFFDSAAWLRDLADQAKNYPYFGLSADLWLTRNEQTVLSITAVESVDTVIHPAAGGTFAIPAEFSQKGNHDMETQTPIPAPETTIPNPQTPNPAHPDPNLQRQLALLTIQTAGLPQTDTDAIRAQYEANPCSPHELDQRIALAKQLAAARAELTTIQGLGAAPLHMLNSLDKITLATEKLLGVESARNADVPRLTGIRELYDLLTGDHERYGRFRPDRVTFASATTSTMASIVANALNKVLTNAFQQRPQWWKPIVSEYDFTNLNDVKWVTLGGIADLDTVSEGAAYTEKAWDDNYETSAFVKKGNYIGLTLEMIDRDDVGAVRQLPRKLGYAAARTLAGAVSAIFTASSGVGPTLADSKALFHADHGNLRTTALSADEWDAVIQAMYKQAELNSSKRLGIRPRYCLVPIELEKTALTIFTSDREPGTSDNDANVRRMSDSVITVPDWTDNNNWAAVASPLDLEGICIGYRFGREPEVFVADDELTGSMFTNDELRIKVRFIYAVGISDYRALHKSNVA